MFIILVTRACFVSDATIYVGGLDDKVGEAILWELFLQAGPVGKSRHCIMELCSIQFFCSCSLDSGTIVDSVGKWCY